MGLAVQKNPASAGNQGTVIQTENFFWPCFLVLSDHHPIIDWQQVVYEMQLAENMFMFFYTSSTLCTLHDAEGEGSYECQCKQVCNKMIMSCFKVQIFFGGA